MNPSPRSPRGDDEHDVEEGEESDEGSSPRSGTASPRSPRSPHSPRSPRSPRAGGRTGIFGALRSGDLRKGGRKKALRRCLRWCCSRKRCGYPKCRCCIRLFPCFYCCQPDQLLDKKALIEKLKKASGGQEVNMALVEDTLNSDQDRVKMQKKKWRSRWRVFCCTFCTLLVSALAVIVVIFAISPWTELCTDCGWSGRAYFGATITSGGRIILLGGRDDSQNLGDVWSGSKDGQSWNRLVEYADFGPRHGHALLCDRNTGELFVMGGDAGGVGGAASVPLSDVWLSIDGKSWVQQTGAAPWAARKFFGAVIDSQGRLYIAGGLSGHGSGGLNDVWRSQDKGVSWEAMSLAAPWSGRHSMTLVRMLGGMNKDKLYILGGTDGFAHHDVWEGNPEGTSWELMQFTHRRESSYDSFEPRASWSPRASAAAVADTKGLLKIFGGLLDEAGAEGFFSREAWQLPSPEGPPTDWWAKQSSDNRLNVRSTPMEWVKNSDPPWAARSGLQGFVDPADDAAYILGGQDTKGFKTDLWKEAFSINFDNLYNMIELMFLRLSAQSNVTSSNSTDAAA